MSNVIAINAAAKQSIAAARAISDEMLLQSIARGDRTSMHVLYSRHNVRVYRFVLRMVRDTTMAEDLVSQVFLDVWRTASQFEGRSQVSTWLLSIARFKALTALRQRKHEDIEQEDVLEIADDADTPEASLDRSNTSAILRAANALDADHLQKVRDVRVVAEEGNWILEVDGAGDLTITFTILTTERKSPAIAQAIEMLRTARRDATQ